MANQFWGSVRKVEHPNYDLKSNTFICAGCGASFDSIKEHAEHVFSSHSQEFAYDNLPAQYYHRLYRTDEYLQAEKRKKDVAQVKRELKEHGITVRKSSFLGLVFSSPEGALSYDDIKRRFSDLNIDILK